MLRPMSFRSFFLPFAITITFGCGGKVVIDATGAGGAGGESSSSSTSSGMTSPDCEGFCAALPEGACASGQDCINRCNEAFARGCAEQLSDFLSCIPQFIDNNCLIFYLPDGSPCDPQIGGYTSCLDAQSGPLMSGCTNVSASLVGTNSCKGEGSCGIGSLHVECTGDGECACSISGKLVGNCKALINGVELCGIGTSCCSAFFNHF